jgi:hypothetical protein
MAADFAPHSSWCLICAGPHHGVMVKKLERLAGIKALQLEQDRLVLGGEKLERSVFRLRHAAQSWPELVLEVLGIARRIHPVWKMTLGPDVLAGETGADVEGSGVKHQMPLTGLRVLGWQINAAELSRQTAAVSANAPLEMVHVESSAIEAVGYDPAARRMRIRFKEGQAYDFCGVPPQLYQALLAAESKGLFYAEFIRGRYPC